jgi:acyl dehydratase
VAELVLPESAGRRYAALDGDRSPMHLYRWSARLMGFPRPVANVAYLVACAEAAIAEAQGGLLADVACCGMWQLAQRQWRPVAAVCATWLSCG